MHVTHIVIYMSCVFLYSSVLYCYSYSEYLLNIHMEIIHNSSFIFFHFKTKLEHEKHTRPKYLTIYCSYLMNMYLKLFFVAIGNKPFSKFLKLVLQDQVLILKDFEHLGFEIAKAVSDK